MRQPLLAAEVADKFDILILADGGGPNGQAGAARLGIARALLEFNSELRPKLKQLGLAESRPALSRAQEVRSKGRAQAVPVLEEIVFAGVCARHAECVRHIRKYNGRFRPAHTNSALGRVRGRDRAKPVTR